MKKIIVIKNIDGGGRIIHPAPNSPLTIEETAEKDVPSELSYRISTTDKLPARDEFRDAWTDDNPTDTIDVDIAKARIIRGDSIRKDRDEQWEDFDKRYVIAQRDSLDMTALEAERLSLKEAVQAAETLLASAVTEADIRSVTMEQVMAIPIPIG